MFYLRLDLHLQKNWGFLSIIEILPSNWLRRISYQSLPWDPKFEVEAALFWGGGGGGGANLSRLRGTASILLSPRGSIQDDHVAVQRTPPQGSTPREMWTWPSLEALQGNLQDSKGGKTARIRQFLAGS